MLYESSQCCSIRIILIRQVKLQNLVYLVAESQLQLFLDTACNEEILEYQFRLYETESIRKNKTVAGLEDGTQSVRLGTEGMTYCLNHILDAAVGVLYLRFIHIWP